MLVSTPLKNRPCPLSISICREGSKTKSKSEGDNPEDTGVASEPPEPGAGADNGERTSMSTNDIQIYTKGETFSDMSDGSVDMILLWK